MSLRYTILSSIFVHVALLAASLIGLSWPMHARQDASLAVEWIEVAEIPEEAEPEPEPILPPEPEPEPEPEPGPILPPEPEPEPELEPEPEPEPKPELEPEQVPLPKPDVPPDPLPKPEVVDPVEEEPEPEPEEETIPPPEEKAPTPEPPPPPPEKRAAVRSALLEDIASLLDEIPVREPPSAAPKVLNASDRSRLELLLNSQIRKCWFLSPEMEDSGHTVRMRIWLREDGSLARRPELLASNSKLGQDRRYRSMVDSARRAVLNCAPFEIPEELFISEFIFNFETDGLN